MSKIAIMSETLANKIAAGEVIEKTASVVKELVENAIDAAAQEIKVELINGGLNGITVSDDGTGMDATDATMAFARHATSKVKKDDDLFFINTLGFRGEALPSIASVSEIDMLTSTGTDGTHLKIKGGKIIINEVAAAKKGTKIKVTNLFYNTPARLKYLKSEQTELANCVSYLEKLALSYPGIRFTLINNDNPLVSTTGSNNLKKTIHEIYGLQIAEKLLEVKASNDDYDLFGYICKPEILKSNRNYMITIVNGRVVKNLDLNKAINDAYYTYKPDIKYPVVFLNILTDPTLIDVNIHPTKQDIKMSKISGLNELITKTIKDTLYHNLLIPDAALRLDQNFKSDPKIVDEIIASETNNTPDNDYLNLTDDKVIEGQATFDFGSIKEETVVNQDMKGLVLYPVGAALGTYIIAENDTGIYLIDQHAAQERINYERYLKALKEHQTSTITSLIPITIELSASDALKLKNNLAYLKTIGLGLEEFGINTFTVKEEPSWLLSGYEEASIREIIDLVLQQGNNFDVVKFNEHIAITLACKMAIKANMHISHSEMETLLNNLVKCDNPYNCPHGRPTIIKFSIYDLERMFKRVMN
jgi:DNA mismatch repair protein MutL